MKKYIQPNIKVVEIESQALLADSIGVYSDRTITSDQQRSKGLDDLDRGDFSDNSLWSKDRW